MSIPSQGSLDYKLCRNLFLTHSFTTAGPRQEQDFQDLYLNLILYFKSTQSEKAKQVLKSSKEQGLSEILQNLWTSSRKHSVSKKKKNQDLKDKKYS